MGEELTADLPASHAGFGGALAPIFSGGAFAGTRWVARSARASPPAKWYHPASRAGLSLRRTENSAMTSFPPTAVIRSTATLLLAALLLSSCGSLGTRTAKVTPQRPKISNDTRTTAFGTFEVEAGSTIDPGDLFDLNVRVKAGVSPTAELFVELAPYINQDLPGPAAEGVGDLMIGFRQRLMNESKAYPATAFELVASVPTGETDLVGAGNFPNVFGGFSVDRTFENVYATAYYRLGLLGSPEAGDIDIQHTGALAGVLNLDDRWNALGELAFQYVPETSDGPIVLNLAALYDLADTIRLDAGAVLGLNDDAPDFALRFGVVTNLGILF